LGQEGNQGQPVGVLVLGRVESVAAPISNTLMALPAEWAPVHAAHSNTESTGYSICYSPFLPIDNFDLAHNVVTGTSLLPLPVVAVR
jgi:hypothetical protein